MIIAEILLCTMIREGDTARPSRAPANERTAEWLRYRFASNVRGPVQNPDAPPLTVARPKPQLIVVLEDVFHRNDKPAENFGKWNTFAHSVLRLFRLRENDHRSLRRINHPNGKRSIFQVEFDLCTEARS